MALLARSRVSPERTALALAIEERDGFEAELAAAQRATEPAAQAVENAEGAVEAAQAALEQSKSDAAKHLTSTALGTAGDPPRSIRDARAALLDAEDTLEAARAAQSALMVQTAEIERRRLGIEVRMRDAVRAVVGTEGGQAARRAAQELARLQREMVMRAAELDALIASGAVPLIEEHGAMFGKPIDPETRAALYRLQSPPRSWHALQIGGLHQPVTSDATAWQAAIATLGRDATAPLPGVPTRSAA